MRVLGDQPAWGGAMGLGLESERGNFKLFGL